MLSKEKIAEYQESKSTHLMDELIHENKDFIEAVSKKIWIKNLKKSMEFEDVYQSAVIGFINGIQKYDASRGENIDLYFSQRMKWYVYWSYRNSGSKNMHQKFIPYYHRMIAIENRYMAEKGKKPEVEELAEEIAEEDKTTEKSFVQWLCREYKNVIKFRNFTDASAFYGHGQKNFDQIVFENFSLVVNDSQKNELSVEVRKWIRKDLNEVERKVIKMRYFNKLTLREIGDCFNKPWQWAQQMESKALKKLNKSIKTEK